MIEHQTIPHDFEAEQAVLGAIMTDNSCFNIVMSIIKKANRFYTPAHQHIFRSMFELIEKNEPIDSLSLGDELKSLNQLDDVGGYAGLSAIENSSIDSAHISKWCKIISEHAYLRQLISLTTDIARKSRDPEQKAKDLIDELIEKSIELRSHLSTNAKAVSVFDCMPEIINNIELVKAGKKEIGITSGYHDFDRHLGGGAQIGDLIFLGAEPSVGKTSLAVCLSFALVYRSRKGLIASIESSKETLIRDRLLPAAMSVNSHLLRSGKINQDEWDYLLQLGKEEKFKNLKICDESVMTVNDIYSMVAMEARTNGIDFLMIDYMQLIAPSPNTGNRNQDLGAIGRGLKRICKDFNIPVVVLSQLTGDKLRDSGELEHVADVIILLKKDEDQENIINCHFNKNRNGIKGRSPLYFTPEFTQFKPVE